VLNDIGINWLSIVDFDTITAWLSNSVHFSIVFHALKFVGD